MGVESKIRDLLEGKAVEAELVEETIEEAAGSRPLDKAQGDATNPTQGSSDPNPEKEDLSGSDDKGGLTSPVGKAASAKAKKDNTLPGGNGAGEAPNYSTTTDPTKEVNKASSAGNVHQEEVEVEEAEEVEEIVEEEAVEEEVVAEEETMEDEAVLSESDIDALFADEEHLSEDFKVKAASLFEAVVTARVTAEVQEIEEEIASQAEAFVEEYKSELVESVDKYLSYVSEQWMAQNELAIENGLKNEVTESFIKGLKEVFVEHYIDMPEEKYDVLSEMQKKIDTLEEQLNTEINEKIEVKALADGIQRQRVFEQVCEDLAQTETEKFASLVEDVSFDDNYEQKLRVIKENYFPKKVADTSEVMEDTLEESAEITNTIMGKYAHAISKSAKF